MRLPISKIIQLDKLSVSLNQLKIVLLLVFRERQPCVFAIPIHVNEAVLVHLWPV